jgi:3-deoxy-manno-octulosonate cytidylyltransferase (CMP-KDO synthetase)
LRCGVRSNLQGHRPVPYKQTSSDDTNHAEVVSNFFPCNSIDSVSTTPSSRIIAVIPARLASTRLPRKVLRMIAGRPMLAWVVEAARACPQLDEVIVATDSEEVAALCAENNWLCKMTSPDLQSGTDRVHAVALETEAAIYVNIQGDEPLLRPEHITMLLAELLVNKEVHVSTLRVRCTPENIHNPNAVKVVADKNGRALYFSRSLIPFNREGLESENVWKHIGIYAYRREILLQFPTLPASQLEQMERLEQLRLLENGIPVHVVKTEFDTIGVDTDEDLKRVELLLMDRK